MKGTLEKTETREWITMENRGQLIFGILHRPVGEENPPIVVFLHGFASSKHGSGRCYVYLAELLAKEGIATLRFDFRGSGDSEGDLSEMTLEDLVSDANVVFNHLVNIEGIDSERCGFFGSSLGGTVAILSSITQEVKALALWAPVASGELWYRDMLAQNPQLINADIAEAFSTYRGETIHPLFREQFSQMHAAKTMRSLGALPILHMHGEEDMTISMAHQKEFRKYGNDQSRFITFAQSEHNLGFSKVLPQVIQEIRVWFKKHL